MYINLVQVSMLMLLCLAHLNMKVGARQHLEMSQRRIDGVSETDIFLLKYVIKKKFLNLKISR